MHRAESSRVATRLCMDPLDYPRRSNEPGIRAGLTRLITGDPRAVAESSWEAIMASLVVLGLVTIIAGACVGAFFKLSFAIRRGDRIRGQLRFDPPSPSARAARDLVGISGSRWE